jgi:hypothetical protein
MTDSTPDVDPQLQLVDPRIAVLQAVADRVTSWQDGATPETVRLELDAAIAQSDIEVDEETRARIVQQIVDDGEHFDVRDVLT